MKKFSIFSKAANTKSLEIRADFRLGSDLTEISHDQKIYVRAEFLNLGGMNSPDDSYLKNLKEFCQHFKAQAVHATFGTFEHRGIYFFYPVPPIFSPKLLPKAIPKLQRIQDKLGFPISVRNFFDPACNLPTYMPQGDFFFELTSRSRTGFICDVKSTRTFARSFGEDEEKHLRRMTEIEGASAFVREESELSTLKNLEFSGPLLSFDHELAVHTLCEGEFDE